MRIIGGSLSGKKIIDPIDKSTRPLKDLVRESIFNILDHSINEFINLKNAKVLDLFSGTGSFGIECLSRGAGKVVFYENYSKSLEVLKKNINKLGLSKKTEIFEQDAYNIYQDSDKFDLIFFDPPFKDNKINLIISKIKKLNLTNNNTIIIIHRNKNLKEKFPDELNILREKNYGLSKIIFGKLT